MDIIVSDFDGVLFNRYRGLYQPVVDWLNNQELPVYIVTFRKDDQLAFIRDTVADHINLWGIAFAGSRQKDPMTKARLIENLIGQGYHIVHALDNDERVVVLYNSMGIPTSLIREK